MRSLVSKGIVLFAGILASPVVPKVVMAESPVSNLRKDPRLTRLKQYFQDRHCPLSALAEDFLIAADENALDWRLLPSISMVESSGGKAARNNNVLGWGSAASAFPSVRAGIHAVARRLSTSKLYKNKDLEGMLRTYNTNAEYPLRVKQVMKSIGPLQPQMAMAMD